MHLSPDPSPDPPRPPPPPPPPGCASCCSKVPRAASPRSRCSGTIGCPPTPSDLGALVVGCVACVSTNARGVWSVVRRCGLSVCVLGVHVEKVSKPVCLNCVRVASSVLCFALTCLCLSRVSGAWAWAVGVPRLEPRPHASCARRTSSPPGPRGGPGGRPLDARRPPPRTVDAYRGRSPSRVSTLRHAAPQYATQGAHNLHKAYSYIQPHGIFVK